jgi:hypothetical protein
MVSRRSWTVTSAPTAARWAAAESPPKPAPTTDTDSPASGSGPAARVAAVHSSAGSSLSPRSGVGNIDSI